MGSMLTLRATLIKLILPLVTDGGDLCWNLSVTIVAAAAATDIIIMLMADAH